MDIRRLIDKTVIKLDEPTKQIIITTPVEVTRVTQDRLGRVYIRVNPVVIQVGGQVDQKRNPG